MQSGLAVLINLPFVKPKPGVAKGQAVSAAGEPVPPGAGEKELQEKLELYRLILTRYHDLVEEKESKTILDMKALVKPFDKSVLDSRDRITDSFHPYIYSQNFGEAAKKAIDEIRRIRTIQLPLNFWLSFDEMVHLGAGDEMDKAIFLCSLLRSLESEDARVIITESKKPCIIFSFNSEFSLLDADGNALGKGTREEALKNLGQNKTLYSFNDRDYEDYVEEA